MFHLILSPFVGKAPKRIIQEILVKSCKAYATKFPGKFMQNGQANISKEHAEERPALQNTLDAVKLRSPWEKESRDYRFRQ